MSQKILVVEDNPANLELFTDLLEAAGYQVHAAISAEEGVRLARALQPELILMDLSLPGMDGLAATRALREDAATCDLRIVALTAHAMKGDEAVAQRAGCNGYLTKPIDTRSFVESVSRFIARQNGFPAKDKTPQP